MYSEELIVYRGITADPIFQQVVTLMDKFGQTAGTLKAASGRPVVTEDPFTAAASIPAAHEEAKDLLSEPRRKLREEADACISLLISKAGEYGFTGNLWHDWLCNLLVNDENTYSRQAEIRGEVAGSINEAVLYDFRVLQRYFDFDFAELMHYIDAPELSLILNYTGDDAQAEVYNRRICGRICELARELEQISTGTDAATAASAHTGTPDEAEKMKAALTDFYRQFGVGRFGLHKAFRISVDHTGDPHIQPINRIPHVYFRDLVGYERQKQRLIDNTEAFVDGRPCNNVLLYGEAGTGKSSSIKALANEYYEKGLRVIEVYRQQFQYLNDVIAALKNRNYRFIIYMDDLSFEEFETEYKYLKAVIEGGLEKRPDNVLIYATSNRRHLIRESFHDRDGVDIADKHGGDTVQEKLSLSGRFGVSIYYGAPTFQEYHAIVEELARRHGITMDKDKLDKEATAWEMHHGGLSGRTAQQFIDYLLGTELASEISTRGSN